MTSIAPDGGSRNSLSYVYDGNNAGPRSALTPLHMRTSRKGTSRREQSHLVRAFWHTARTSSHQPCRNLKQESVNVYRRS
jgi:hypothetical protein